MKKATILIVGAVVIVAVLVLVGFNFFLKQSFEQPKVDYTDKNVYGVLVDTNQAFARGEELINSDPKSALLQFQSALSNSKDLIQEGQIKFKIAQATENTGDYAHAIALFKEIATNPNYTNITRAYSIQEMGMLFYSYSDPQMTTEIFSTPPFSSLYVATSTSLSYRHLFEYTSSIYPLAISELRIADWYASAADTLALSSGAASSTQQINTYKTIIGQKIKSAQADITRIRNNENENVYLGPSLMREAVVVAKMQLIGDSSFGDMDTLFKQTLNFYSLYTNVGVDGYARYNYALYLARIYGDSQTSAIQQLLSNFYTSNVYHKTAVETFFKNERSNGTGSKVYLVKLASIDPKFKAYLMSLGWQASDFGKK